MMSETRDSAEQTPRPDERAWFDRVPAHIRYPGMVVLLLGGTVLGQVFLVNAAFSGGGPQIEKDYYERAVEYEDRQRAELRSDQLGWSVQIEPAGAGLITARIEDARGRPVPELTGEVVIRRPDRAGVVARRPLARVPGQPGLYRFSAPRGRRHGLWDLRLSAEDPVGHELQETQRLEW